MTVGNRYFIRRPGDSADDFEEGYWGVVVDPDGKVRDRRGEREQFLEDVGAEIAFLRSLEPGRILDVGCGLGFLLSALGGNWEKHGVEVSTYAAKYASRWGRIHHGDLPEAEFPDEFFDVVVMFHVIEHISEPVQALREVCRVLRRGGRLLLATPDFDSGCARRFGEQYRLLHDKTHISLFSADSMHRFLRDNGFVIERADYPFFDTRHFTAENLLRLLDTDQVSPPFYGNFMTFYCRKPQFSHVVGACLRIGVVTPEEIDLVEEAVASILRLAEESSGDGGTLWVFGTPLTWDTLSSLAPGEVFDSSAVQRSRERAWLTAPRYSQPDPGPHDLVLLAPATEDEARLASEAASGAAWRSVAVVPEAAVHMCEGFDVVLPIPTIHGVPSRPLQDLLIQGLLLELKMGLPDDIVVESAAGGSETE